MSSLNHPYVALSSVKHKRKCSEECFNGFIFTQLVQRLSQRCYPFKICTLIHIIVTNMLHIGVSLFSAEKESHTCKCWPEFSFWVNCIRYFIHIIEIL